ncbi:lysophospholipid acyltransferase family protein [Chachezhania sediminis]|uniref:lysophospholipid acyltransferase family protein n=1 Tax=Chachezhania sediminis TaxID=2599291 RepID=UPI00131AFAA0|nr:lysophospholipid acyltransferase family protein [Chachezhania sediminis]
MRTLILWLRSAAFSALLFVSMGVMGIALAPVGLLSRRGARWSIKVFARWVFLLARWLVGIRTEWRGPVPQGDVLVVAKHQSFLDVLMLFAVLPRPRFVMKHTLVRAPVFGLYALRVGCIPVDRRRGAGAMTDMVRAALAGEGGQLVIYPQGTRVEPGAEAPYRPGVALLYDTMKAMAVPVATNAGLVWPRKGLIRRPGRAVVEFLDPVDPGLTKRAFLTEITARVEMASDRLLAENQRDKANGIHRGHRGA